MIKTGKKKKRKTLTLLWINTTAKSRIPEQKERSVIALKYPKKTCVKPFVTFQKHAETKTNFLQLQVMVTESKRA